MIGEVARIAVGRFAASFGAVVGVGAVIELSGFLRRTYNLIEWMLIP